MLTIEEIQAAYEKGERVAFSDPVYARAEFPFKRVFYPLGFPVEIATNAKEILEAAAQSWSGYSELFYTQPIQLQVAVSEGNSSECPPAPVCRVQRNLLSNIADRDNFGISDMARGFSSVWLTPAAVAHPNYLRYFFLDAAVLCQLASRYTTAIHAACIEREGVGILLCGDSGAGKSTLSYACAQAGWTFIADDASFLIHGREDRMVVGNCNQIRFRPSATVFFPELKGLEITQRAEAGKPSIELCTAPFQHISRSHCAHVEYIVFLDRQEDRRQDLVPFSKEVAAYFMRQPLFSMPETLAVQNAAIDRLLDAEVLQLRYRELGWAIERLEHLANGSRA